MKLEGRDLSINIQGVDVRLLHAELSQLGFEIPPNERAEMVFGRGTETAVKEFQERYGLEPTGIVDQQTADLINRALEDRKSTPKTFVVKGRVLHADGKPFVHGLVRAFDKDLRSEELLGEATTDGEGHYEIGYSAEWFHRAEKKSADLLVRCYQAKGEVATSPIFFNAQPEEIIDLIVEGEAYRGPSEFEQLVEDLMPLLGGLAFAELTEDEEHQDVTFLSGESGLDPQRIALLIQAHRLLQKTDLAAEAFYGFFREGLPTQLSLLLVQSPDVMRRALLQATKENVIPARFEQEIDRILERLKEVAADQAFTQEADEHQTPVVALLETVLEDAELQKTFLTVYVNHTGPIEEFWQGLRSTPEFKDHVDNLQFTFQLGAFTGNHLPLMRELRQNQKITSVSDLARFDEQAWHDIISKPASEHPIGVPPDVPGKDNEDKAWAYARMLANRGEDAFPTQYLRHRLDTDNLPAGEDLKKFFDANPDFNLRTMRLDTYLKEKDIKLEENTRNWLGAMQRVYKVAPRYRQMSTLLKNGFDSAYRISSAGQNILWEQCGEALGDKTDLKVIIENAQQQHAMAATLLSEYGPMIDRIGMHVLPDEEVLEVDGVPEWSTLFGSLELCECEHCRSVLSPAAYLVDLLHFLSNRKSKLLTHLFDVNPDVSAELNQDKVPDVIRSKLIEHGHALTETKPMVTPRSQNKEWLIVDGDRRYLVCLGNVVLHVNIIKSAKDTLFERRADLGEIELTCENTNTPLPYVDLANEVLENAVAPLPPFVPFELDAMHEVDLNKRNLSKPLREAFDPPLPEDAVITVGGEGKAWELVEPWWTIDDPTCTYTIRKVEEKNAHKLWVETRGRQTKGSVAERAANPQYLNPDAYTRLRQSVYPWSLPFDLWWEEARAYLGHLGVARHEIMETFHAGKRPDVLDDPAIACEYLGLTYAEQKDNTYSVVAYGEAKIITGDAKGQPQAGQSEPWKSWAPGLWNLWGFETETLSPRASIADPSDSTQRLISGMWWKMIRERVDVFLQQSGLKYKELLDLLDTHYINPINDARQIRIESRDPENNPDTCETDLLSLSGLNEAAAGRIVRFVRLWRKLGWSMRDLDRAITAFGLTHSDDLSEPFLVSLAHVQRLHNDLRLPVIRLLSCWADNIDTAFYVDTNAPGQPRMPSLYEQLFRNRTVTNSLDPDFPEDPCTLDEKKRLRDKAETLTAALGLSTADLSLLIYEPRIVKRRPPNQEEEPDDKLTLENLSKLHRHASLAKALKLSIRDYLRALALINPEPFATTADTVIFVEKVGKVNDSGFSLEELDYLLRHEFDPSSAQEPDEKSVAVVLGEIRSGLQQIADENRFSEDPGDPAGRTSDPTGDLTRQKLALLNWDSTLIEQVVATFNGAVVYETPLKALPANGSLPNTTGSYEFPVNSLLQGFSVPPGLDPVVTVQPVFLFTVDEQFAEKLDQSQITNELQQEFASNNRPLGNTAIVNVQAPMLGKAWRIIDGDQQYLILKKESLLAIYDETHNTLKATRFLNPLERSDLENVAKGFGNNELLIAVDTLFKEQDALQGEIRYDADRRVLCFSGIMTNARKARLDAIPNSSAEYLDAVQALYNKPRNFIGRYMRTYSVRTFKTKLKELPAGLAFPKALNAKVFFDKASESQELQFLGVMTEQERDALLGYVFSTGVEGVVVLDAGQVPQALEQAFATYQITLPQPAPVLVLQAGSQWRIDDGSTGYLIELDKEDHEQRLRIYRLTNPADPHHENYRKAIRELFDQPEKTPPQPSDAFLIASGQDNDAAAMFDGTTTAETLFLRVLKKLLPYLQQTLSERLVAQKTAETFTLETRIAEALLKRWIHSPVNQNRCALAEFLDPGFANSSLNLTITVKSFPAQFQTFTLFHKISTIIVRFELTALQLAWLFEAKYGRPADWIDFNTLPTRGQAPAASFENWLKLVELSRLRDALQQGEKVLDDMLVRAPAVKPTATEAEKNATKKAFVEDLSEWTLWSQQDLEVLLGKMDDHKQLGFLGATWPGDYVGERLLVRLQDCFVLLKRLGMSAPLCLDLTTSQKTQGDVTRQEARGVIQAVRAKYDEDQWLTLARPLRDVLREKQRAALVAYLVAHLKLPLTIWQWPHPDLSQGDERLAVKELQQKLKAAGVAPKLKADGKFGAKTHSAVVQFQQKQTLPATGIVGAATWKALDEVQLSPQDVNDLYAHFLIDVEMTPCMMTSRIKQAISSTQLFVQRCLMNLEQEVAASAAVDTRWREWKWMKNYRVWEANRKIFLYPENWIEPELRDDKSPFFRELESELLQSDLTQESAETAFLHYLEKLDQVARLEIVGMYHQLEQDEHGNIAVDILHVFGRTYGIPHIYFYRQRVDSFEWTAWERVDLDIEGDHLLPIVWNRRLYLFWPIFTEKAHPLKVTMPKQGDPIGTEPQKYWEIQLAWSERKEDKWTNKSLSSTHVKIDNIVQGVTDELSKFFFRWSVDDQDNLNIFLLHPVALFGLIFGGKLWVFHFDGCHSEPNIIARTLEHTIDLVRGTFFHKMYFQELGERQLYLPTPTNTVALNKTPGTFLLLPHFDGVSIAKQPFFYLDNKRTFFVAPSEEKLWSSIWNWSEPDQIVPEFRVPFSEIEKRLKGVQLGPVDGLGPVINPADPLLAAPSFPVRPELHMDGASTLPGSVRAIMSGGVSTSPLETMDTLSWNDTAFSPALMTNPLNLASSTAADVWSGFNYSIVLNDVGTFAGVKSMPVIRYRFDTFYHPYVCAFVNVLNRDGIDGLLQRQVQTNPEEFLPRRSSIDTPPERLNFKKTYDPQDSIVDKTHPKEEVDFKEDAAYALYNWELFCHAQLLIADQLMKNQRFKEAQQWLHYIFDPTDTSSEPIPQRYWRTKKFFDTTREDYRNQRIQSILKLLAVGGDPAQRTKLNSKQQDELDHLEKSVRRWRKDPFKPHSIARLRTVALQKTVVMKYIDNLIGWADQLFRRDTIESINEATQLYVLAAEILGRRPESVSPRSAPQVQTYNTVAPKLGAFSNALVQMETFTVPMGRGVVSPAEQPPLTLPGVMLYFCVPKNEKLLGYWDTVADRLFKVRHCMNIEGVVRQLPLFESPIEPGLLVKAAAAGVDISSVLNDINAALPHYRFNVLAQKVNELCAELKSLGAALLSALEKRDAEELALLRSKHETSLLKLVEQVRKQQVDEAVENLKALWASRHVAVGRYLHYQKLLGVESPKIPGEGESVDDAPQVQHVSINEEDGIKMIPHEEEELENMRTSNRKQRYAAEMDVLAKASYYIPTGIAAFWGVGVEFGGRHVGPAVEAIANRFRADSLDYSYQAQRSARLANHAMRAHEWAFNSNQAAKEFMQIDQQIAAAEIGKQISEKELANHRKQLGDAQEVEEYLRDKYTNQELYSWMIGKLATTYFQTYQLAYDLAKRTERAFRYELGLKDSNFVQFGCWDSLKKGLLSGECLYHDLKRMEVAYLDQNKREYEITKHISLLQLDPMALLKLKQTGRCEVSLPEALFDLDCPGHYMRRIKSVSVTIPCVTGPYTSVNCTLTLLKSSVRHSSTLLSGQYARDLENEDPRFTDRFGAIQSIVTSNAQNDSGLFELNFRDERYLPFEGTGAISEWRVELPDKFRQFDYDTISDVVIHMRYTAQEGGSLTSQQATTELETALNEFIRSEGEDGLTRAFSLRHEFPNEWHKFIKEENEAGDHIQTFTLSKGRFPFFFQGRTITLKHVDLFGVPKKDRELLDLPDLTVQGQYKKLKPANPVGQLLHNVPEKWDDLRMEERTAEIKWEFTVTKVKVGKILEPLDDIIMVFDLGVE